MSMTAPHRAVKRRKRKAVSLHKRHHAAETKLFKLNFVYAASVVASRVTKHAAPACRK